VRCAGLCIVIATGCGRLAFDPRVDASGIDAALGPFGTPVQVTELNVGMAGISDDDPTLTDDMLEIYFNSNRSGGGEILRSTRTRVSDPWSAPQPVNELNSAATENTPQVSGDGLTIYLSSSRISSPDIFVSTRASRTDLWSVPALVAELSGPDDDTGIHVSPDGLTAYLNLSTAGMIATAELYRTTRTTTAMPWSTPTLITELSSPLQDTDAFVTANDQVIYWASDRSGNQEIWRAKRPATGAPFAQLEIVGELATPEEEEDVWISPDGRTLYLSRGPAIGTRSIYMTTR
jgi:hypothetical protein